MSYPRKRQRSESPDAQCSTPVGSIPSASLLAPRVMAAVQVHGSGEAVLDPLFHSHRSKELVSLWESRCAVCCAAAEEVVTGCFAVSSAMWMLWWKEQDSRRTALCWLPAVRTSAQCLPRISVRAKREKSNSTRSQPKGFRCEVSMKCYSGSNDCAGSP